MNIVDYLYTKLSKNDPEKVSAKVQKARLEKCKNCTMETVFGTLKTVTPTGQCAHCTCFVNLKTQYKAEKCPKGKW